MPSDWLWLSVALVEVCLHFGHVRRVLDLFKVMLVGWVTKFDGLENGAGADVKCFASFDVRGVYLSCFDAANWLWWKATRTVRVIFDDVFSQLLIFKDKVKVDEGDTAKAVRTLASEVTQVFSGDVFSGVLLLCDSVEVETVIARPSADRCKRNAELFRNHPNGVDTVLDIR